MTVTLLVPGRLTNRSGGSIYDRRIAEGLRSRGWSVDVRELDDSFSFPTAAALDDAARALAAIPDGRTVIVDGLAFSAMPLQTEHEASRLRLVALVHALLGSDDERRALAAASLVIVTGRSTIAALERYGVERARILLVEPGTDRAPLSTGSRASGGRPLELLSVAALTPGKGHEILFRALAAVPLRDWHLTCAGSLERDPATVERLHARLRADGLDDRVTFAGELDDAQLADAYDRADLFVLATLRETYGMAVAEALAHGLPVVGTMTGAIPDLVGKDAGVIVPAGDVDGLTAALTRVLEDARLRERMAEGARRVRDRLPTWDAAASTLAAALERVTTDGRVAR